MNDAEILAFRARLTATIEADDTAAWSFSDTVVRLIDYCNRALGCGMHEGQVWRGPAGFSTSSDSYRQCTKSREIVAAAIVTLRRLAE
jgi:hypothetical protein